MRSLWDDRAILFGADDGRRLVVAWPHELEADENGAGFELIEPGAAAELVASGCDDATVWPELLDLYRAHIGAIVGPPSAFQIEHDIKPTLVDAFARGRLVAWRRPLFDQPPKEERRIFRRAVTPSLPSLPRIGRIIKEKTFLDVTVIDDDEQPVVGKRFKLELPSGATEHGRLDGTGRIFRPNIDPGTARLTFLAEDADAIEAEDLDIPETTDLDVTVVDADQQPMVGARYKLELPNGEIEHGRLDESGRLFRPNIDAGTALLTLFAEDADAVDADDAEPEGPDDAVSDSLGGELGFFAIRVVDEAGEPVDDVALDLVSNDKKASLVTAGGEARLDDVPSGEGVLAFADVEAAREILKARAGPQAARASLSSDDAVAAANRLPSGPLVRSLVARGDGDPVSIDSDVQHTIVLVLPAKQVHAVEVDDGLFRLDSAVVLPEGERPSSDEHEALTAAGLFAAAILFAAANPDQKMLVAGHTDTSGTESHNQALSEDRARCSLMCLEGPAADNRQTFGDICDARHKISDYKQVLSWAAKVFGFSCDPGKIDDQEFTGIAPIKAFQGDYNANRAALGVPNAEELAVDGSMGPKTWRAVFDCYEAALADELSDAATRDERLKEVVELRKNLAFVDSSTKSQGFGEDHPIDQIGRDNFRSQANRRVELLFFNQGEEPDLTQAPEDSEIFLPGEYERIPIDPEAAAQLIALRLCDPAGDPIPAATCTLTVGQTKRTGQADAAGIFTVFLPVDRPSILVEWRDPALASGPTFREETFLDFAAGSQGSGRRLENLGYEAPDVPQQIAMFRADFGRAASTSDATLVQEATTWHDGGKRPSRSTSATASNQTFPAGTAVA